MSEHGSGEPDAHGWHSVHAQSSPHDPSNPGQGASADTYVTQNLNLDLDFDIRTASREGGGGGGGGIPKHKTGLSLAERARVLGATVGSSAAPQPSTKPHPAEAMSAATPNPHPGDPPPPAASSQFPVANAYVAPAVAPPAEPKSDSWSTAGSLKPLENEVVVMRRAGSLTDVFRAYVLISFVMLTNRRIVVKQSSSLFGLHLYTLEASFLYENLRHVSVQRVTEFRFLGGSVGLFLLSVVFFGLTAANFIFLLFGFISLLASAGMIYWFIIFYNSNSLLMDFSKGDPVGTWQMQKGKGAFITKVLILHIDHCFDIMYTVFDQARTIFADNNA